MNLIHVYDHNQDSVSDKLSQCFASNCDYSVLYSSFNFKAKIRPLMVARIYSSVGRRLRQEDFCKLETSLVYLVNFILV